MTRDRLRSTLSVPGVKMPISITSKHLRIWGLLLTVPESDSRDVLLEACDQDDIGLDQAAIQELYTKSLDQWQAEQTRLFLNGYPRTPCPPFESVYRHQCMGGPVVADLQHLYQQAGLFATAMPADYLGVELDCAAYLLDSIAGQTTLEPSCAQAILHKLCSQHWQHWLSRFATDLQTQSQWLLYRQLGKQLLYLTPTLLAQSAFMVDRE
jgi:TorA maturation chaperone TorD